MSQPGALNKGILIVTTGFFVQQAVGLIASVIVARMLGASEFGTISVLRNFITILLTLTPLGLDLALLKHAAYYDDRRYEFWQQVTRLRLVTALLNVAIVIVALGWIDSWLGTHVYKFRDFSALADITFLGLPFAADLALMSALYRADNRPSSFALMTNFVQPFVRLGGAVTLLQLGLSTEGVVLANTAAYAVSSVMVTAHSIRMMRASASTAEVSRAASWAATLVVLKDSIWMAMSLFVGGAVRSVDTLAVGIFTLPKEVGAYGALSAMAQLVQAYPFAASQTLGPTISRHYRDGNLTAMRQSLSGYLTAASIVGGFAFGGTAGFGDHLDLLFGHSFRFRSDIAFALPLGWLISATLGPMGYSLSMTGRHRAELAILAAGLSVLVVACGLLTPRWGQLGAASAVVLAFTLINSLRFLYLLRIFGFLPGSLSDFVPPLIAYGLAMLVKTSVDALLGRCIFSFVFACCAYSVLDVLIVLRFFLKASQIDALRQRIRTALSVVFRH